MDKSVISVIKFVTLNLKLKYLFPMVPLPKALAGSSFITVPMFGCSRSCVSVHHPTAPRHTAYAQGVGEG